MKTLYVRNLSEEVSSQLEILADREGISLSELASRELTSYVERVQNATLLSDMPDHGLDVAVLLEDIDAGRASL